MSKTLVFLFLCVCLFFPSRAEAGKRRCGRPGVPAALRATQAKQKRQNNAADGYNLSRLKNRQEIEKFIAIKGKRQLVLVTETGSYYLDPYIGYLDPDHRHIYYYARIWVKHFLDTELTEARRVTGDRFKITSLVRPRDYQRKLHQHKSGAIVGKVWWRQSTHSTGATVDISFEGLSLTGHTWLRQRLRKLQAQGKIIAVEEACSGHFHLMILPSYR